MVTSNELVGIGLRCQHYTDVLQGQQNQTGWFEVHSENYFYKGSSAYKQLCKIKERYPISLHGIALSLGSYDGLDYDHLARLKTLIRDLNPILVSEHLSWSRVNNIYLPDLLPVVYTDESANIFIDNIKVAQDYLARQLLVENPSSYFEYKMSSIAEADFLVHIAKLSGAKILLDINNIFVSCSNHGWDSFKYIDKIPADLVGEIHLAGHSLHNIDPNNPDQIIRIDTHSDFVCAEVWDLYRYSLAKFGPQPTLLEWDQDIPQFEVLVAEANKAKIYLDTYMMDNYNLINNAAVKVG